MEFSAANLMLIVENEAVGVLLILKINIFKMIILCLCYLTLVQIPLEYLMRRKQTNTRLTVNDC